MIFDSSMNFTWQKKEKEEGVWGGGRGGGVPGGGGGGFKLTTFAKAIESNSKKEE